jgi:hypothetical protein
MLCFTVLPSIVPQFFLLIPSFIILSELHIPFRHPIPRVQPHSLIPLLPNLSLKLLPSTSVTCLRSWLYLPPAPLSDTNGCWCSPNLTQYHSREKRERERWGFCVCSGACVFLFALSLHAEIRRTKLKAKALCLWKHPSSFTPTAYIYIYISFCGIFRGLTEFYVAEAFHGR